MTHPDREKERYYQAKHQKQLEYQKRYHAQHPAPQKKCHDRHRATHRRQERARSTMNYNEARAKLFEVYDAQCSCCGESTKMVLQLHHVKGNGKKERQYGGQIGAIKKAIAANDPKSYMILCPTCHYGMHKNHGVCPVHKSRGRERASC